MAAPAAPEWVSAHVFYADDLDPLLVKAVAPLVRELVAATLVERYFFVRYWDGGHHLRLRCRPTPGNRATVELWLSAALTRFLRAHPARQVEDPADYAAYAAELARLEGVPDYQRRPRPTNTVAFLPYRREHERYGHGASVAAVERHFGESSEIVLGWLEAGLSPAERSRAALAMTLIAWYSAGAGTGDPGAIASLRQAGGAAAAQSHRREHDAVLRLAAQMRALVDRSGDLPGTGGLLAWARSVRSLHRALGHALDRSGGRTPFGVVDICAHLACNRLGVGPDQERHLRSLAMHAITGQHADARSTAVAGP